MIVKSLVTKLQNQFHVSAAEIDENSRFVEEQGTRAHRVRMLLAHRARDGGEMSDEQREFR